MPETDSQSALESCEDGIVSIFADLAELFGNPRSYGILYGLLFTSDEPLNIDIIRSRSRMSQGSISQGLRVLELPKARCKASMVAFPFAAYAPFGKPGPRPSGCVASGHLPSSAAQPPPHLAPQSCKSC
jgi:hypothetical protein